MKRIPDIIHEPTTLQELKGAAVGDEVWGKKGLYNHFGILEEIIDLGEGKHSFRLKNKYNSKITTVDSIDKPFYSARRQQTPPASVGKGLVQNGYFGSE